MGFYVYIYNSAHGYLWSKDKLTTFMYPGSTVYMTFPDHALWRSRTDGRDQLQLMHSPTQVTFPCISPDGKQVAFGTIEGKVYVMNLDGTSQREISKKEAFNPT